MLMYMLLTPKPSCLNKSLEQLVVSYSVAIFGKGLHKKLLNPSFWLCVLQGVNKDSYLILETLPTEYDSRVKAMEVDERPTEQYSDIGGLDKQIQEVIAYV